MNHFILSALLVFFSTFVVGSYFILKPERTDRLFGLFWLVVAFWSCFVGLQVQWLSWISADLWGWFLHLGCIFVPVIFFHFAVRFSGDGESWILVVVAYLAGLVLVLLNTFSDSFTEGTVYREVYAYPKPSLLYPLYIIFFQLIGIWATVLIFRMKSMLPLDARAFLYLFLVVHLLAYAGSMDNFLIMYDIRFFPLYPYGLYFILPYVFLGSFAYLKLKRSQGPI